MHSTYQGFAGVYIGSESAGSESVHVTSEGQGSGAMSSRLPAEVEPGLPAEFCPCTCWLERLFALVEEVDGRFARSRFSESGKGNVYKEVWPVHTSPTPYREALSIAQ